MRRNPEERAQVSQIDKQGHGKHMENQKLWPFLGHHTDAMQQLSSTNGCPYYFLLIQRYGRPRLNPPCSIHVHLNSSQAPGKTRVLLVVGKCPACAVRDVVLPLQVFLAVPLNVDRPVPINTLFVWKLDLSMNLDGQLSTWGWKSFQIVFIFSTAHVLDWLQLLFS